MHSVRETIARYTAGPIAEAERQPRVIDLFCGAGGMSEGFRQVGFRPVWANDFNEDAARTYRANLDLRAPVEETRSVLTLMIVPAWKVVDQPTSITYN